MCRKIWITKNCTSVIQVCPSHHCGVPAAYELPDLVKDAFAVDRFVQRAPLHDDRHRQQDLLADILLQTEGKQGGDRSVEESCRELESVLVTCP